MKIRAKLIVAFSLLGMTALAISVLAERPIGTRFSTLEDLHAPALYAIQRIEADIKGAIEESFAYVVAGVVEEKEEYLSWQRNFETDIAEFARILDEMDLSADQMELETELLASVIEHQREMAQAAEAMFAEYEATGAVSLSTFEAYEEVVDRIVTDIEAFVVIEKAEMDEAMDLALETIERSRAYLIYIGLGVLGLAMAIGIFLAELIRRPVAELVRVANSVGDGDLGQQARISSSDELGDLGAAFNAMIASLNEKTTSLDNLNREVEQRKRVEEQLVEEHDHVSAMMNALPDMLFEVDSEYRILDYRAPRTESLYATPDDFLGKSVGDALPPDAAEVVVEALDAASRTGAHFGASYSLRMPEGESWYELSIARRGEAGPKVRYVVLVRDISARVDAEVENLALERQVQHAQKLESLGVLAGGIAHDFNNLLVGIIGNTDLALSEVPDGSPMGAYLEEIEKASKRAADLSNQMLAYSGKGRFIVESIAVNELIEEMANLLEASTLKSAILRYRLADDLPSFEGDPTQIRQVIMNLITNASEAIGDAVGTITLTSGIMRHDGGEQESPENLPANGMVEPLAEGDYIFLGVTDTGAGMDQETIDKIFDPFFTTKFTGRGLGMSAVLGIVRGHSGSLRILSEPGEGTSFEVFFPVKAPNVSRATRSTAPSRAADAWRGSGTVLIVDDDEVVLRVGKKMLERFGFNVLTATDGREALNLYREHSAEVDCVLLDLTMPQMDGEETLAELRSVDAGVTVILCSGFNEQDVAQRFSGHGPAGFVQKPYKLSELRDKLRAALEPPNSRP